ncbi:NAD(P)H-quinone oxidoreductase [Candidatus Protochlamydia phocaeensis]|uniref:NAD(P)H-quinone oxidoreductase n=1 Tax=Candidatus Protochlamydia phocaeensis TaxID=1414722 RepID=UPI000A63C776|nr:NAD(P)H-quinone oxidoreductase [Candidatus Protochlamydia phocaeensis]
MISPLPSTMAAIEVIHPGDPSVLKKCTRPTPQPGPDEVLIEVKAAGVNRPDIMQRKGLYPPPPGASDIPGLEAAGIIAKVGANVKQWKGGEKVCALLTGGGYAAYCTTPAVQCLPIPTGLNFIEAASLPETFFTVWSNVFVRAHLASGESLLVQGGSSGIGVAAIQMAYAWGCRVFATAGSTEKCRICESLGAEKAINYRETDFAQAIKDLTQGQGVDVILDMVGGDYVPKELSILAEEGRLVLISTLKGSETSLNLREIMMRRLTLTGSTLRNRSPAFKGAIAADLRKNIWPLIETGKIKPVIYRTFAFEEAAEAHRLMESGSHSGKIILTL